MIVLYILCARTPILYEVLLDIQAAGQRSSRILGLKMYDQFLIQRLELVIKIEQSVRFLRPLKGKAS